MSNNSDVKVVELHKCQHCSYETEDETEHDIMQSQIEVEYE